MAIDSRPKGPDSEKITINLGYVDLGHIDLLVQDGFYQNRSDSIRTAIRNQLERHADVTSRSVARQHLDLGLRHYSRKDLEAARAAYRQKLSLYRNGLTNMIELNMALNLLYRAETDLAEARYSYCRFAFKKAMFENQLDAVLQLIKEP